MKATGKFLEAVRDYRFLLEKGYPVKQIIKLTGDRYQLSGVERSVLYRGVATAAASAARKDKLVSKNNIRNRLVIDTFNQLLTVGSYLNGNLVFISSGGLLRDASEVHGKIIRSDILERSTGLISGYLKSLNLEMNLFFIDKQKSGYDKTADMIHKIAKETGLQYSVIISTGVDEDIISTKNGTIATSDSQIIDRAGVAVFDLARNVLEYYFSPVFFNLSLI